MTPTAVQGKFRDQISDWPPSVVEGRRDVTLPIRWEDAIVDEPVTTDEEFVRFFVIYERRRLLCSFQAPDNDISKEKAGILRANKGKPVASM
jgi:hypothetical protein